MVSVAGTRSPLEVRLLGPVEVWAAGRQVDVGPAQRRAVLAALAVDVNHPVSHHVMIDRIWDGEPPTAWRSALHAHTSRLRRLLADSGSDATRARISLRNGGYMLTLDDDQIDVHRFRRLTVAARRSREAAECAALVQPALALWRGPALTDVPGAWADRVRSNWQQHRIDAAALWADAEIRLGHPEEVLVLVRDLVEQFPTAEPLVGVLMRALAALGRDADALSQYAAFQERLVQELGTQPGPDLRAVHQAVLRGELTPRDTAAGRTAGAPPAARVPAQLPADVAAFTGRGAELAMLDDALVADGGKVVIVAVCGTAGVGNRSTPRRGPPSTAPASAAVVCCWCWTTPRPASRCGRCCPVRPGSRCW